MLVNFTSKIVKMKPLIFGTIKSLARRANPPQVLYKVELLDITSAAAPVQSVFEKQIQVEQYREPTYFNLSLEPGMFDMNPLGHYLLRVQAIYEGNREVRIDTAFQEIDIQQQTKVDLCFEF